MKKNTGILLSAIILSMIIYACSAGKAATGKEKKLLPVPDKLVVFTFDDAVASHYTYVAPLLKQYGFSATFFVTEGFNFHTNKKDYLTWEQIKALYDDGFEIGNHTRDHMGIFPETISQLKEQVEVIAKKCEEHGIPRPVSFSYPGNFIMKEALPVLEQAGILWARRGNIPEFNGGYDGRGFAYWPGVDDPLLVPSAGIALPGWSLDSFRIAVQKAEKGKIAVIQFHGVPDREHPWVHTDPELFRKYLEYLRDNNYKVIAMRDLSLYVDPRKRLADPWAIIDRFHQ